MAATKSRATGYWAGTWYVYGEPSGSVVAVSHARKPQPCFAVSTADVAPTASMESTQLETLSFTGLNDAGSLLLQPPLGSQPFQFERVQPGSPSWKKVLMPK